jgi:hypothetical protein
MRNYSVRRFRLMQLPTTWPLRSRLLLRTSERLACYDAASPPKIKKPAVVEDDASRAAYQDPFIAEDARTAARLKNICRGC